MKFFDQPPTPPTPPPPPRRPEWFGPPDGWLGGFVPVRAVLVRTGEMVVALGPFEAFPDGVGFDLRISSRQIDGPGLMDESSGGMRLGVSFSDGGKWQSGSDTPYPPGRNTGPILVPRGGGGGDHSFTQQYWLWPLPPPGPVTFALTWPDAGIDEGTADIDAALFQAAAAQAERLWEPLSPEEEQAAVQARFAGRLGRRSRGGTYGVMTAVRVGSEGGEPTSEPDPHKKRP